MYSENFELGPYKNSEEFKRELENILKFAREITRAEVGVLFLTVDQIFLEAADWSSKNPHPPPASELPTYRLKWWEKDDGKLDGITSYVAVRRKVVNLNTNEVFSHPAWKGKWDAVFLGGERTKCKGILAVPIQSKIGDKTSKIHGVLKVENPDSEFRTSYGRFTDEQKNLLIDFSQKLAEKMERNSSFWRQFVSRRADLKVSYIVELLERGRPICFNLFQSINYVNILFKTWLNSKDAVHVFWCSNNPKKSHILKIPDFSKWDELRPFCISMLDINDDLVQWMDSQVGPKILQRRINISDKLWNSLFFNSSGKSSSNNFVDIIRLKTGQFDLGAIILPESPIWRTKPENSESNKDTEEEEKKEDSGGREEDRAIEETLTRLATNVVSIIGRFIEDEYETKNDTYLPLHRPPRSKKVCAILFADIRNFSILVQILRQMDRTYQLEPFIDNFCLSMGKIIDESAIGRVDKFLGDGLMALFGEYIEKGEYEIELSPTKKEKINSESIKVVVAVDCARRMLKDFKDLNESWINDGLTRRDAFGFEIDKSDNGKQYEPMFDYKKQFNEDVRIDLTIGINLGEIYLDYFGDPTHREYTAIGDHINFTHRIRGFAGDYDESIQRK
jgi:class 3 adenylate cyclase